MEKRIPWNKGKKGHLSETTLKKLRDSHVGKPGYWIGKKRPNLKLSHNFKKGFTPWNNGKKATDEAKKNQSESHIGQVAWNKGLKNHLSKETVDKIRQSVLANPNRTFKDTKPEKKVEAELIRLGVYFEKQRPLCKIAVVDFYIPEYHIVIQVDGCYWHNCPIHSKIKLEGKTERDIKQDRVLMANGFNVYRIWEHDIMGDDFNLNKILIY